MPFETAPNTNPHSEAVPDVGPSDGEVIVTSNLWKTYEMGAQQVNALCGINLRVRHNEYVAIMGPSGSGKSTLMNLIGCLDSPTRGRYWLNGHDVSSLNDDELARIRNKADCRYRRVAACGTVAQRETGTSVGKERQGSSGRIRYVSFSLPERWPSAYSVGPTLRSRMGIADGNAQLARRAAF